MNILYGLAMPDEGRSCSTASRSTITGPSDAIDRGISMVHQHFMLVPVLTVAENILLGEETMANPVFLDRSEAAGGSSTLGQRFGFEIDPDAQGREPVGRLAAAGRDPQGALPRGADPRPRRADRRADAAGDRGDLRGPAPARRGGPQHHLHQPQALRGPRDRRPDHGHPAWQGRRPAAPGRDERGGPGRADGRPERPADGRPRRIAPGRGRPVGRRASRAKDDRGREAVRGVDLEVRAGEILGIAGVAGNGQDELVEALDRAAQADRGRVTMGGTDVTGWTARASCTSRPRLRPGRPPPLRARAGVPARATTSS